MESDLSEDGEEKGEDEDEDDEEDDGGGGGETAVRTIRWAEPTKSVSCLSSLGCSAKFVPELREGNMRETKRLRTRKRLAARAEKRRLSGV